MELIASIPVLGPIVAVIVPFLVVLAVVVFVHEFGHYIVGRWCGIHAETFSIGFGKPLYSWVDSRGTKWQVAALPLGGFVKFVGDMDPASAGKPDDGSLSPEQRAVAFHTASLPRRAATVLAGPVANFLLSILIFAVIAMWIGRDSGEPVIGSVDPKLMGDVGFQSGDRVLSIEGEEIEGFGEIMTLLHKADGEPLQAVVERDGETVETTVRYRMSTRIDAITPGWPAAQAGMLPGDLFVSIDGKPVHSFYGLQVVTAELPLEEPVEVVIERGGEEIAFTVTPRTSVRAHPITVEKVPQATFGVRSHEWRGIQSTKVALWPHEALQVGVSQTWGIIDGTVTYLGDMIFANADYTQLGGPIRIAEMSGEKASEGAKDFIYLIAVLSTSIGLLNLFPIPVLDGGHLMFYAVEAVRGRPLKASWMQVGTMIGLSLVLSLMVFATYNDITRVLTG